MSQVEVRLEELGLVLPEPLVLPSPNRTSGVRVKNMLYLSGHGAALLEDDTVMRRGKLGAEVSQEEGYRTARALALKMLATIKHHVGDLDRVERVIKVLGMINAVPEFETHKKCWTVRPICSTKSSGRILAVMAGHPWASVAWWPTNRLKLKAYS